MPSTKTQPYSKLVYIHELDSVRNSEAEIRRARERLYEEIIINGNIPVISFNQLADSKAFLGLITDTPETLATEESDNDDFSDIGYLMKCGRIKIARFLDKRTASQYLQDNLAQEKTRGQSKFVLSGWPIPQGLNTNAQNAIYEQIRLSLRNSDPDYIDDINNSIESKCQKTQSNKHTLSDAQIAQTKKLVNFILSISKTKYAYADINCDPNPNFLQLIKGITKKLRSGDIALTAESYDFTQSNIQKACDLLDEVRNSIHEGALSRSTWYNTIQPPNPEQPQLVDTDALAPEELALAYQILDLSYNITTESGIDRCSLFFDPSSDELLNKALGSRLSQYVDDYIEFEHIYTDAKHDDAHFGAKRHANANKEPSEACEEYKDSIKLDWGLIVNIQNALDRRHGKNDLGSHKATTYGSNLSTQRKQWRHDVFRSFASQTGGAILYTFIFGFIEVVLSLIDGLMEDSLTSAVVSEAVGVGDILTFNRTMLITAIFIIGVAAYGLLTRSKKQHGIKAPLIGIGIIFFILLPLIACVKLTPNASGAIQICVNPADFLNNFRLVLPSILVGFIGVVAFTIIGSLLENRTGLPGLFDSMKLAKDSIVDSCKFASFTCRHSDLSKACAKGTSIKAPEDERVLEPNAWKSFLSFADSLKDPEAQISTLSKSYEVGNWDDYVALIKSLEDRVSASPTSQNPPLKTILDRDKVETFSEQSGKDIGIMYDSPYNTLVVDLVEDTDGSEFAYERLIPKNDGAVVMIPVYNGRFILLDQYRYAIGEQQLCFPRGFGESNLSAEENAAKELREEIGVVKLLSIRKLGELTPDSGISTNKVSVFLCEIENYDPEKRDEGILGIHESSLEELSSMIKTGQITDGFTLAAIAMYQAAQKE